MFTVSLLETHQLVCETLHILSEGGICNRSEITELQQRHEYFCK